MSPCVVQFLQYKANVSQEKRGLALLKIMAKYNCIRYPFIAAVMAFSASISALSVNPMTNEVEPFGRNSRTSIVIENTTSERAEIEISAWSAHITRNGEEQLSPETDDIIFFPPAVNMAPGASQTLQIQYVGDPETPHSKLYRVQIERLPIKRAGRSTGVEVKYLLNTMLHVAPASARADVEIVSISPDSKNNVFNVEVVNKGNRFAEMRKLTWLLKSGENERQLGPRLLRQYLNGNLVLPESSRVFSFSLPEGFELGSGELSIEIE